MKRVVLGLIRCEQHGQVGLQAAHPMGCKTNVRHEHLALAWTPRPRSKLNEIFALEHLPLVVETARSGSLAQCVAHRHALSNKPIREIFIRQHTLSDVVQCGVTVSAIGGLGERDADAHHKRDRCPAAHCEAKIAVGAAPPKRCEQ